MDTSSSAIEPAKTVWSRDYEWRAVSLLAVGFGLVGLDRFIINPLFPVIAEDLNLDYQDLGLISGILALTWGLSSVFAGNLSDRIGLKRVLVISVIAFSALVGFSGLATGLVSLLIIRALMGFAEGGFVPASIVATIDASKPTRKGLNIGLQQMAAPLVGLGFGPLIAIALLGILPSWHYVFGVIAIPGFIVAYLLRRTIREPSKAAIDANKAPPVSFKAPLQIRNVVFGILGMFCFLTCLHTLSTFMPSYLVDYRNVPLTQMGFVLAVTGLGGFVGMVLIPSLSDRYGRRRVMLLAMGIELVAFVLLLAFARGPLTYAALLFIISLLNSGVVATTVGPFLNESVPAVMAATAVGLVSGFGEIVGGAFAPALSGAAAQAYGIHIIPWIGFVAAFLGTAIVAFGFREPALGVNRKGAM
ncbi:MAG: MFS transporter [Pseudomonadota bacterium]